MSEFSVYEMEKKEQNKKERNNEQFLLINLYLKKSSNYFINLRLNKNEIKINYKIVFYFFGVKYCIF